MNAERSNLTSCRLILRKCVTLISLGFATAAAFSLAAEWIWLAELIANLRLQLMLVGVALLAATALFRQRWILLLLSLSMGVHGIFFVDAIRRSNVDPNIETTLRVATINVLTSNKELGFIADEIRRTDADVVAVLELSTALAATLRMEFAQQYPYQILLPLDHSNFGIGLISRDKLTDTDVFELNESIRSISARCNGFNVIATHPLPPMNQSRFASRNEHLRLLAERIISVGKPKKSVVMGDFNVTPWSPHFHRFQRRTSLRRATKGQTAQPTWFAVNDWFLCGLPLDHVWISSDLDCTEYEIGNDVGSDHRAVVVGVGLR